MIYAQYRHLGLPVTASRREVIRAARTRLSTAGKTLAMRAERHTWIQQILACHDRAFVEYAAVVSGRI